MLPYYYYKQHLNSQPQWIILLSSLGTLILLKHTFSLLKWAFISLLRTPKDLKEYGPWALITGSTDGIGRAFAFELARMGLNLILISRNLRKLELVCDQVKSEYPNTDVKIVVLDFSCDDVEAAVEAAVEGVEVGVVVNNVGVSYASARYFDEVEEKEWMTVVKVNLEGTTRVTRAVLGGMLKRKRGAIVNIGSGSASAIPSHPLFAIYAATKAYVDQLSRCLYMEYKHFGIDVQCQVVLFYRFSLYRVYTSIETCTLGPPLVTGLKVLDYECKRDYYWDNNKPLH